MTSFETFENHSDFKKSKAEKLSALPFRSSTLLPHLAAITLLSSSEVAQAAPEASLGAKSKLPGWDAFGTKGCSAVVSRTLGFL